MKQENNKKNLPFFGIPKIYNYLLPQKRVILISVVTLILTSSLSTLPPVFNKYAIDHFLGNRTTEGIFLFSILYLLSVASQTFFNAVSSYFNTLTNIRLAKDLQTAAFRHIQTLSFSYFNKNNVGNIHSRLVSDIENIAEAVCWTIFSAIWDIVYILSAFVIMFLIDANLALLLLILLPIISYVFFKLQGKIFYLNKKVREDNSIITGDFNETILGAKDVKILTAEKAMKEKFHLHTIGMRKKSVHLGRITALSSSTMVFFSTFAVAIVLMQGGKLTKEGAMAIGSLTVFMSYASEIADRIRFISGEISYLVKASANIARFDELMKEKSEVFDTEEVIEKYGDSFHPKKENWEPLLGEVEFKNVTFRYPDGEDNVLENFNLKVQKGTHIAIVGETGAGKSTLVNLVCRFFEPTEGEILIDGKNVKERSIHWLHSNIGYVLQAPHLFSGTIRENLRYGKADASEEEMMRALSLVSATSLIEKLEKGLDTEVGEGGDNLSTGEKQLISFARAIIGEPAILILDEATSSIDTLTEKAIQDATQAVIKGRTSFVIAHRLSTIVDADMILVVKNGKIIEQGRHKELLAKKGYYHSLYTKQFEDASVKEVF